MTNFENVCKILHEMHVRYTEEGDHAEFVQFNDLGVPLAYLSHEGLATPTEAGKNTILETWGLLMKAAKKKDVGFTELDEVLD